LLFFVVTGSNNDEENKEKTKIKDKLKKYLSKRPSFNELESKGIISGIDFVKIFLTCDFNLRILIYIIEHFVKLFPKNIVL